MNREQETINAKAQQTNEDVGEYGAFTHRQILTIIGALVLSILLAALDQTIVTTALPTIAGELHGLNQISWLITAYLLAQTVAIPIYGKMGDIFGRKNVLLFAIVLFLVGSALAGAAPTVLFIRFIFSKTVFYFHVSDLG
jgi:MFS family permease